MYYLLNGIRCDKLNATKANVMANPDLKESFSAAVTHFQDYINATPSMKGLSAGGRHISEMGSRRGGGRGRRGGGRGGRRDGRGGRRGNYLGRRAMPAEVDKVIGRVRDKYVRGDDAKFYIKGEVYSQMSTAECGAVRQIRRRGRCRQCSPIERPTQSSSLRNTQLDHECC